MPSVELLANACFIPLASTMLVFLIVLLIVIPASLIIGSGFSPAAVLVPYAVVLMLIGACAYCQPVEELVEWGLEERHEVASLDAVGYRFADDGGQPPLALFTDAEGGSYTVVVETDGGGFAAKTLPDSETTVYPVDDLGECRLEEWQSSEVLVYRDGSEEVRDCEGAPHEEEYRLYVPEGSIEYSGRAAE